MRRSERGCDKRGAACARLCRMWRELDFSDAWWFAVVRFWCCRSGLSDVRGCDGCLSPLLSFATRSPWRGGDRRRAACACLCWLRQEPDAPGSLGFIALVLWRCESDMYTFSSSLHLCEHAALRQEVTDEGLCALASAGCGENLTSLTLECKASVCLSFNALCSVGVMPGAFFAWLMTGIHSLLFFPPPPCKRAALGEGVTDSGLRALTSAGCGECLMSLTLSGECLFLFAI